MTACVDAKASRILLEARGVSVRYHTGAGEIQAVTRVDLSLEAASTVALVGESGCGKSTLAKALIGLEPLSEGSVTWAGQALGPTTPRRWLSQRMQMVFQDPDSSLNPRMTVGAAITEPLIVHAKVPRAELNRRCAQLSEQVGIEAGLLGRYPHELSGGQKQRICVARALAVEPELLICDEAVSALDVSIQAQLLNLLRDLQRDLGIAYLFITHDLSVVRHLADEVCVMYLGRIVERGPTQALFQSPLHPYTQALLRAVPSPDPRKARVQAAIQGDVPSPLSPPSGCHFHPRCPERLSHCSERVPRTVSLEGRSVRCFLHDAASE